MARKTNSNYGEKECPHSGPSTNFLTVKGVVPRNENHSLPAKPQVNKHEYMSSTNLTKENLLTQQSTTHEEKAVASSLICRATLAFSKGECSRDMEIRVRALHVQLSEQARGQTSKCGYNGMPNCVVTIVKPIQVDRQPPPSVAGSSASTLSSVDTETNQNPSMKLRRTYSIVGLQSLQSLDTIQQESTQQDQDITVYGEDGWGYFDDFTENVSEQHQKSFFARIIAFLQRPTIASV